MRELKFRLWDKKKNEWYKNQDCLLELDGSITCIFQDTFDNLVFKSRTKDFEIVQYTGLKDKNGKGIYEGDILKVPDWYDLPENTSMTYNNQVVTFEEFSFCLNGTSIREDHEYISEECEVIGDIYENPELIEGETKQ